MWNRRGRGGRSGNKGDISQSTLTQRNRLYYLLSTVIPAVVGLAFLIEAYTIIRETSDYGPEGALGGLMGVIGPIAITFGQYLTWQTGQLNADITNLYIIHD